MTTGPNRLLDELAKLMTDAAGAAQGVRREVETAVRGQAERFINRMELVSREEFDAARDMAAKARAENAALAARIAVIEAKLGIEPPPAVEPSPAKAAAAKAKPAVKRAAAARSAAGGSTAPKRPARPKSA